MFDQSDDGDDTDGNLVDDPTCTRWISSSYHFDGDNQDS